METGVISTRYCAVVCLFCTANRTVYDCVQLWELITVSWCTHKSIVLPNLDISVGLLKKFLFYWNNDFSRLVIIFVTSIVTMVVPTRRDLQLAQMEQRCRWEETLGRGVRRRRRVLVCLISLATANTCFLLNKLLVCSFFYAALTWTSGICNLCPTKIRSLRTGCVFLVCVLHRHFMGSCNTFVRGVNSHWDQNLKTCVRNLQ